MKNRMIAVVMGAALCVAGAGVASAEEAGASAPPRLVHQSRDAAGTLTRVYYTTPTDVTVDIRNSRVAIQKRFAVGRSETTIASGSESIRIVLDPSGLVLTTQRGTLRGRGSEADARRIRSVLAGSAALQAARVLLQRTAVQTGTPVAPLLLTTKAFLDSLGGDLSGYRDVSKWAHQVAALPSRVVKVDDGGPTDCWNEYVKEAVAAYDELVDCVKNLSWWDMLGDSACHLVYDMRALGAFSWWLNCTSLDRKATD